MGLTKVRKKTGDERTKGKMQLKHSDVWSGNNSPGDYSEVKIPTEERVLNSFSDYIADEKIFTTEERIPDRIQGYYTYDYNICKIDEILQKIFEKQKRSKPKKYAEMISQEQEKMRSRQNMIERNQSKKRIADWEQMMTDCEKEVDRKQYEEQTRDLLKRYQELGSIKQIVSFASNTKETVDVSESEEQQKIRHQIIFEYLEVARKYIKIDLLKRPQGDGCCFGCGSRYEDLDLVENEPGVTACPICGLEFIKVVKKSVYSDGQRVSNAKNNYEDRVNFEKVLLRFQGKQVSKPDGSLYQKIDEWFIKKNLPSQQEFHKRPLTSRGKKRGATKELMYQALSEIGCSGYYDDINLICHIFYGLPLPDIGHLEDIIMHDYDVFQKVYDDIDKDGRKSSLNSQWKLYILLRRQGLDCKMRDFKIPTTPHILDYHKIITKQIYEQLGWECNY